MLKTAGPETGEVTIRFPVDGCGIAHEATATQFICIYRDMLGMLRVDMHDPDDDMVSLLDERRVLAGYVPIEP